MHAEGTLNKYGPSKNFNFICLHDGVRHAIDRYEIMTAQLLASELTNLIQESRRKHNDLRQAAEKSLDELRSLRVTSETQIAGELSQRANFANPFIIACGTKNIKFTGIAIVCLQRLIVSRALPRSKLNQVLEALQQATSAGLDVQLKILQALPSLLSNYAADIQGELLVTALNICFIFQSSKNAIVNNTSAATLQQLVVSVFDQMVAEDKAPADIPMVGEAPTQNGTVQLRTAAMDAYRVFNDLCLLTENQRPDYLRISGLPQTFGLELIESVLTNHAAIFSAHPEQANILRARVIPFLIGALRGRPNFATSVRIVRILYTVLRRHLLLFSDECGDALDIMTQLLDQENAIWKRSLCMEVFRGIFAEAGLLRRIYMLYDIKEGQKDVLKSLTATFVRVSTEKPSVIGLGHQSSIPVANPYGNGGSSSDQAMLEASGVTGIVSGSVGSEGPNTGISNQWSPMRVPCIDQLDKTEAPPIPESYIYSLTLACITSLSEGLAKFILPLTVPGDGRKRKVGKLELGRDLPAPVGDERPDASRNQRLERSPSFKRNPVPVNPLMLENHPLHAEIKICAAFVDECWPAILATCSTFLSAALDSEYYHGLVRAFQKFAHVAGLLQLNTPRDAFLTTLGKAAVPPNVFTACLNAAPARPATSTPTTESSNSIFSNARGLLSVDSLVSQGAPQLSEKQRQPPADVGPATLNTRNLLCLRALLNLGIALGPTLSASWRIILETLQQADFVLYTTGKSAGRTPTAAKTSDQYAEQEVSTLLANFSSEVRAVETAASRLFESTVDFPNPAFVEVVTAVCSLLEHQAEAPAEPNSGPPSPTTSASSFKTPPASHRRMQSLSTLSLSAPMQTAQFALAKLENLASVNLERMLMFTPEDSGWEPLISELISTLGAAPSLGPVRARAAETLGRLLLEMAGAVAPRPEEVRGPIQTRLLEAFRNAVSPLQAPDRKVSVADHAVDVDIHRIILEGLKGLLENCGESLVSGWEIPFEIIDTIFMEQKDEESAATAPCSVLWTRSVKLIRPSFASVQLICSDFLTSLPNSCFLNFVDTLYKFCSQDDDLNVALTTITFFWAISDFLSGKSRDMPITEAMLEKSADQALVELASDPPQPGSGAALWMLLLLRLTSVAADHRLELRNSAIQTLMRIMSAYGDSLSPEAWSVCIRSVIFRLLSSIERELRHVTGEPGKDKSKEYWRETAIVVIQGVAGLFASYLSVLVLYPSFSALWRELLGHFATMLDFQVLDINAATYSAVRDILSRCTEQDQSKLGEETVDLAWDLWSRGIPVPQDGKDDKSNDNQKCLLGWVEALLELYRLIERELTVERVQRMLTLLRGAMQHATPGPYTNDIEHVTPLQGRILEVFRMVRTDLQGVPSAMITQVAEFVTLAFARGDAPPPAAEKRTFVAMSKESMTILQGLMVGSAVDSDMYETGAFAAGLSALAQPIGLKYRFKVVTKSTQPWRQATQSALAVLEATLPRVGATHLPEDRVHEMWQIVVEIANGIIAADCGQAHPQTDITGDQDFDMAAFRKLRELMVPSLGDELIPEKTRKAYAEGLFRHSIVHALVLAESCLLEGTANDAVYLDVLYKPRKGCTVDPPAAQRSDMSATCLDELFALVSSHDAANSKNAGPTILLQPPTPRVLPPAGAATCRPPYDAMLFPPPTAADVAGVPQEMRVRLARTAAPYLLLRCALSLRAYAADQPLRGRMPQPLSQRRELARVLRCLVDLRSEPAAARDEDDGREEGRYTRHLEKLYPLLVRVAGVAGRAGDDRLIGLVGEALGAVGEGLGF